MDVRTSTLPLGCSTPRAVSTAGVAAAAERDRRAVLPPWVPAAVSLLEGGQDLVLITVIQAKGSTPRDTGARMWVDAVGAHDTIGGGHLELQAIDEAKRMLQQPSSPVRVLQFALGPSLGQCCGGVVWLALERLSGQDLQWLRQLEQGLQSGVPMQRRRQVCFPGSPVASATAPLVEAATGPQFGACVEWNEQSGELTETFASSRLPIVLCGAGHVGRAIVKVLEDLPVQVYWLDPRSEEWPDHIPSNITCIEGDAQDVLDMPDEAYWLVLTHSHALDLEIIENVFRHKSFRFLGLIGSKTKRAKFRSRLTQRFSAELVDRMVCPIGLVETSSKLPAVIAVSVVAQLLPLIGSENTRYG